MAKFLNVCFTFNNPGPDPIPFDVEKMVYLVYQREVGAEGTEHYQGYCELKKQMRLPAIKTLLGSNTIHIERRRGTAKQASDYCKKADTRKAQTEFTEFGEMKTTNQGARADLEGFKDAVMAQGPDRKRKRDLLDDHLSTLAHHPKFYNMLTLMNRPKSHDHVEVILHIGEPNLGKTRWVMDAYKESDDFYVAPLSNNTLWFDEYDLHETVLLDDFSGSASHMPLVTLLRLIDRYPVMVPTKGGHTWWKPKTIFLTTNILPKDWYTWSSEKGGDRGIQYLALARRFTKVVLFYPKLHSEDPGFVEQEPTWWVENAPQEAMKHYD